MFLEPTMHKSALQIALLQGQLLFKRHNPQSCLSESIYFCASGLNYLCMSLLDLQHGVPCSPLE